uniref:Agarase n=1 Tax=Solibacter usitatus (strain Ellin6076) TaxID=234267 RepID=Q02B53_SOLUE
MNRRQFTLSVLAAHAARGLRAQDLPMVKSRRKPTDEWKEYPTRTLDRVAEFQPGARTIALDQYGGRADRKDKATGFFYAKKLGKRWFLIDPDGHPYLQAGVCSLARGSSSVNQAALKERFGTPERWAAETSDLLRENGFTASGGWSDVDLLRGAPHPIAYCVMSNFMGDFGRAKSMVHQQPGHLGYPQDCIPVFHPEFAAACDRTARPLAAHKDDPWLFGYFSDNELPAPADLLDRHLKLDAADPNLAPGFEAARQWLRERKGESVEISDADRAAFRGYVFDRYFATTTTAIRRYDPNHLCIGSRMHGPFLKSQEIMAAAGRHLDVLSVNVYNYWTPPEDLMAMWERESGKPFLVTEWYVKADDAGYKNTTGAGWIVPTQKDRAAFYQNFVLALLESRTCVGWHWFKYMDNDPDDPRTDPSNRDSNKGMVTIRYQPYRDLVAGMKAINREIYPLADHFDVRP